MSESFERLIRYEAKRVSSLSWVGQKEKLPASLIDELMRHEADNLSVYYICLPITRRLFFKSICGFFFEHSFKENLESAFVQRIFFVYFFRRLSWGVSGIYYKEIVKFSSHLLCGSPEKKQS